MKKVKILFFVIMIAMLVTVTATAYLYFNVEQQLRALQEVQPEITYIRDLGLSKQGADTIGAGANYQHLDGLQSQVIQSIQRSSPSVVNILISKQVKYFLQDPLSFWARGQVVEKKMNIGGGSGIIISKNGLVITNKHVVEDADADYSIIMSNGTIYTASRIWLDPVIDVAVLQMVDDKGVKPNNLPVASFVNFDKEVQIGQFAIAIGNALAEYKNSASLGIISATNRKLEEGVHNRDLYIGLYQTDTSINPGNSGGPLVDIYGNVLGITTAINAAAQGIGFALPVNRSFIEATIKGVRVGSGMQDGYIKRPFLGIAYDPTSDKYGVIVKQVVKGSPADDADLKAGDIITKINGHRVSTSLPFLYHMYKFTGGELISLSVLRKGKEKTVTVRLKMI